jgi:hemerythrin-like domain-containing protein
MAIEDMVRWLRSEHGGTHQLADPLRKTVATPPRGGRTQWIAELQTRFDEYASHVCRRMGEEEEHGYLQPVLAARPSLTGAVDVLQHEHVELARLIDRLRRSVRQLTPKDNLRLRDCGKRIENLLSWVERHEEHENHIVLYAFAQGPGAHTPV